MNLNIRQWLEPLPKPFYQENGDWRPGVITALVIFGIFHFVRAVVDKKPAWPGSWVLTIGDMMVIVFLIASSRTLRGFKPPQRPRWYHRASWFIGVGVGSFIVNLMIEAQRGIGAIVITLPAPALSQTFHSLIVVPLLTIPVAGVIPHLCEVKGRTTSKTIAAMALAIYLGCLALDIYQMIFLGRA